MLINNIQMTYKFQLSLLLAGRVEFQSRTYHRRVSLNQSSAEMLVSLNKIFSDVDEVICAEYS